MFADYLVRNGDWYSKASALTWKGSHTTFKRLLFQLAPSARPIAETASGLLHTPTASDTTDKYERRYPGGKVRARPVPNLAAEVSEGIAYADKVAMLPTPRAQDAGRGANQHWKPIHPSGHHAQLNLSDKISMLKKPPASDGEGGVMEIWPAPTGKYKQPDQIPHATGGMSTGLRLQPAFVEWMMGYPEGWTELPDSVLSAMRSSRKSRNK